MIVQLEHNPIFLLGLRLVEKHNRGFSYSVVRLIRPIARQFGCGYNVRNVGNETVL